MNQWEAQGIQQQALWPFVMRAVKRRRRLGTITYSGHSQTLTALELPKVGLLSCIWLNFTGTVNVGAAAAYAVRGPWDIIKRIKLYTNYGEGSLVDISGYGAFLDHIMAFGRRPDKAGVGDTTIDTNSHAAAIASGNNTWSLWYRVPLSANDNTEFDTGLLNLQAEESRASLEITTGAQTDAYTVAGTGVANTATIAVYGEYYDFPDPSTVQVPDMLFVRTVEESNPILTVGSENTYQIPPTGILLNLAAQVVINGAASNLFDSVTIKLDKQSELEVVPFAWHRRMDSFRYGTELPTGLFFKDFFASEGRLSAGGGRDAIYPEEVAHCDVNVAINSGASLGAGNNFVHYLRRYVIRPGVPW